MIKHKSCLNGSNFIIWLVRKLFLLQTISQVSFQFYLEFTFLVFVLFVTKSTFVSNEAFVHVPQQKWKVNEWILSNMRIFAEMIYNKQHSEHQEEFFWQFHKTPKIRQ